MLKRRFVGRSITNAITCIFFLFAISTTTTGFTQTIEYSRQSLKTPRTDVVRLVSNIQGNHHIICLAKNAKPALFIFNDSMQFIAKKEIPLKLPENSDINVIPFNRFYFLYLHQPGSLKHELWKIGPDGTATSVSDLFMNLIDSAFKQNSTTFQLEKNNNSIAIIANVYYDKLGKLCSTVTQADENLKLLRSRKIFFEYVRSEDVLKQLALIDDDHLAVLKTTKDSVGNLLTIVKGNLNTGDIITNSFNSGVNSFVNPAFNYNSADSTITICAKIARTVFFTRLDNLLNEKVGVTILKSPFNSPAPIHFLLLQDEQQKWFSIMPGNLFFVTRARTTTYRSFSLAGPAYRSDFDYAPNVYNNSTLYVSRDLPRSIYNDSYNDQPPVRFSLLNNKFKILRDSIAPNDESFNSIHPRQFANVTLQNKSFLFLNQQFGSNRQGILMMYGTGNNELAAKDIRVYDKYDYLIQQMQPLNSKEVLVPYTHKREIGLVKIGFD